jgi:hypothetical protein
MQRQKAKKQKTKTGNVCITFFFPPEKTQHQCHHYDATAVPNDDFRKRSSLVVQI